MTREPWLEPARRQAQRLVEERLSRGRPTFVPPRRTFPLLPLVVFAVVVAASGAWAWARTAAPQVLVERPAAVQVVRRARAVRVVPSEPLPVAEPRPEVRPLPQAPVREAAPSGSDEPFGEVIEVKRPSKLPPLFDVSEYRSRGVMVEENP